MIVDPNNLQMLRQKWDQIQLQKRQKLQQLLDIQQQQEKLKINKSVEIRDNQQEVKVKKQRSISQGEIQIVRKHKGPSIYYDQNTQIEEKYFIKKNWNEKIKDESEETKSSESESDSFDQKTIDEAKSIENP